MTGRAAQPLALAAAARGLLRPSLAALIGGLKEAYGQGGFPALQRAHLEARERSTGYRALVALIELGFPLGRALDLAAGFDDEVGRLGLYGASNLLLDRLGLPREIVWPAGGPAAPAGAPALVYANHPSAIAPILVTALLDRPDVRIVAMGSAQKIGPHFARTILPVEHARPVDHRRALHGGVSDTLIVALLEFFNPRRPKAAARAANWQTLRATAEHIRAGGAAVIFPEGGSGLVRPWFAGIGVIAAQLLQSPPPVPVLAVPVHIENDGHARFYAALAGRSGGGPSWAGPIRLVVGLPQPLADVVSGPAGDAQGLTRQLETRYRTTFGSPEPGAGSH